LPELPADKRHRYVESLGLSPYDATWLTQDPEVAGYFEQVAESSGDAKLGANWVMGELSAALNRAGLGIAASPVAPAQLAALIARLKDDTLSSKTAKVLYEALWAEPGDVDQIIAERGLKQVSDSGALTAIVARVMADNPEQVAQLRAGKDKVLGFLVGQVMKATQGKANPKQVNELIRTALDNAP
ncbi:MAG: Asp-tRNA(Asn)/Glu-tRNA(Gln) amidotransferase GatCAB subunit B, partial [Pseudomonadales bacterium]